MPQVTSAVDRSKASPQRHTSPTAEAFLGRVKWFGDQQTGAPIGFLVTPDGRDVFFHRDGIANPKYHPQESNYVVFTLIPSQKRQGDFKAVDVRPLSSIEDPKALLHKLWVCNEPWRLEAVQGQAGNCLRALLRDHDADEFIQSVLPAIREGLIGSSGDKYQEPLLAGYKVLVALFTQAVARRVTRDILKADHPSILFAAWRLGVVDFSEGMVNMACRSWGHLSVDEHTKLLAEATPIGIANFVQTFSLLDTSDSVSGITAVFDHARTQCPDQLQILSDIVNSCPNPPLRVELWARGIGSCPSMSMLKQAIPVAGSSTQRLLLRHLFDEFRQTHTKWSLSDLCSMGWTDISTSVACECIGLLAVGQQVNDQQVYEAIVRAVTTTEQKLGLDDLFDACLGRAYCSLGDGEDSVTIQRRKPVCLMNYRKGQTSGEEGHPIYCEGRPFEDKDGHAILHHQHHLPFWRCRNESCFAPSVGDVIREDWQKYTLRDFILIAGISCDLRAYQKLLGALNRINEVLDHMRCTKCHEILHPADRTGGRSNYAFYLVTHFQCKSANCDEKNVVYITHCLNGACRHVIDSRDSAQCRPAGNGQNGPGWYVCPHCYCCCTTEQIERRKYVFERRGQKYEGPMTGHADSGEICCPDCGTVLQEDEIGDSKSLVWLAKHKDDKRCVEKHGIRPNDGQPWYLVKRTFCDDVAGVDKWLHHLVKCGFSVPDVGKDKSTYLIGAPGVTLRYRCPRPECGHVLVVEEIQRAKDYSRMTALRRHSRIADVFPAPTADRAAGAPNSV